MKTIAFLTLCTISLSLNAQSWFDKSCVNIDEEVLEEDFKASSERNILKIIVNQAGDIEINDEVKKDINEIRFKELVLDFVTNPDDNKNKADKPEKVYVQIKSLNNDKKQLESIKYFVQDVYLYLWDKEADQRFKSAYVDLNCKKREKVFNAFPLRIIDDVKAEKKKSNNLPRKSGPGLPPFGGDVKKN